MAPLRVGNEKTQRKEVEMAQDLSSLANYQEALAAGSEEGPYVFEQIFRVDSRTARGLSKRKFRLLKAFDALLRKMLLDGEKVYYVSYGVETSFLESMFLGWVMYYLNRRAFVFTTSRILLIQFGGKYRPAALHAQIPYANINKVKPTFLGNFQLTFNNGKKSLFTKMPKYDRKMFVRIIDFLKGKLSDVEAAHGGVENLCPHCFRMIEAFPRSCPACNGKFKSASRAGLLSLIFPGLGDMYLGHRGFAVLEILGALLVWVVFFTPEEGVPMEPIDYLVGAVIVFAVMHGVDALVTAKIGRKGLYPA